MNFVKAILLIFTISYQHICLRKSVLKFFRAENLEFTSKDHATEYVDTSLTSLPNLYVKSYMGKGSVALKTQTSDPVWYCVY